MLNSNADIYMGALKYTQLLAVNVASAAPLDVALAVLLNSTEALSCSRLYLPTLKISMSNINE